MQKMQKDVPEKNQLSQTLQLLHIGRGFKQMSEERYSLLCRGRVQAN